MINKLTAIVVFLLLLVTTLTFQQTVAATTTSSSPLSSSTQLTAPLTPLQTTSPPLTPQELEQQTRLQNVIAATTANLNETEKQVSGVVFTSRWSEPVWVNANSVAVLIAYCLPGEFAESGQEILSGFELEVLESYAVALPQNFMAWMAIVGNEDRQDRLPAAVGVICASDLNNAQARVLSPEEQQQISSINQQITTTTNVENVVNVINNITGNTTTPPPQNGTGGGGATTGQPLAVEIISNEPYMGESGRMWFQFEAKITGGTEPYAISWNFGDGSGEYKERSLLHGYYYGTYNVVVTVRDSQNHIASSSKQLTVQPPPAQPLAVEIISSATEGYAPLTAKFESQVSPGRSLYYPTWTIQQGDNVLRESGGRTIEYTFEQAGTYTVRLKVESPGIFGGETSIVEKAVTITVRDPQVVGGAGATSPEDTAGVEQQLQGPSQIAPREGGGETGGGPQEGGAGTATGEPGGETGGEGGEEEQAGETTPPTQEPQGGGTGGEEGEGGGTGEGEQGGE